MKNPRTTRTTTRRMTAAAWLRATLLTATAAMTLSGASFAASAAQLETQPAPENANAAWKAFIAPQQLHHLSQEVSDLLIIDVRNTDAYNAGHIPNAINIPGNIWRTPSAKPGQGNSQFIFRDEAGEVDVKRYEQLLGEHGVRNDHHIVVYGNHGGKADGSTPAMILLMLGHEHVAFLDGKGLEQWQNAGLPVETAARTLEPSTYIAQPGDSIPVWNLDDVARHLGDEDVVFYDTRSYAEFVGEDLRSNRCGGHIPGAVNLDYAELLQPESKCAVGPAVAQRLHRQRSIDPDETIVLYCQTATRVSLPYLMLRDLGYTKIYVYDASWHEYGNRDDTVISDRTERKRTAQSQDEE